MDILGNEVFFIHMCLPALTVNSLDVKSTREDVRREKYESLTTHKLANAFRGLMRNITLPNKNTMFPPTFRGILRDRWPKQLSRKFSLDWVVAEGLTTRLRVTADPVCARFLHIWSFAGVSKAAGCLIEPPASTKMSRNLRKRSAKMIFGHPMPRRENCTPRGFN